MHASSRYCYLGKGGLPSIALLYRENLFNSAVFIEHCRWIIFFLVQQVFGNTAAREESGIIKLEKEDGY